MFLFPRKLTLDDISLKVDAPVNNFSAESFRQDTQFCFSIGQDRAVYALRLGLAVQARGYNVFVMGEAGLGKHSVIQRVLKEHADENDIQSRLKDVAYVRNFDNPNKPVPLVFPAGRARVFKQEIEALIEQIEAGIFNALNDRAYRTKRDELTLELEQNETQCLLDFHLQLIKEGFRMVQRAEDADTATDIAPIVDGVPSSFEDIQEKVFAENISVETWLKLRERYFIYADEMKQLFRQLKIARDAALETLQELKSNAVRTAVDRVCNAVSGNWPEPETKKFLSAVAEDAIKNADWFISENDGEINALKQRYAVNIVLDRSDCQTLPIIDETDLSKSSLFGAVETRQDVSGEIHADLTMITPGSLLKADGGFLLLRADDAFSRDGLWLELKKFLQTGFVAPEVLSTPLGPPPVLISLQPVKAATTVILMGTEKTYDTLCAMDEGFSRLFKLTAIFKDAAHRSAEIEKNYCYFIHDLAEKEGLKPITPDGIQAIVMYGIELAERRDRISLSFGRIADLLREADAMTCQQDKSCIDSAIIEMTCKRRMYIENMHEQILVDEIKDGSIVLEVSGKRVGVSNGLAVLEQASICYGIPLQISVAVGPGKDGLINIERESGLSGELHDKGIFLLEGYLRKRFSRHQSLSLTASIAVEQSCVEIDGDSASAAELAALLSAIADLPIRQDVAITGSVNQQGLLLAVGGIKQKIQGFFLACKAKGLTGNQGVVLPISNINSIMLTDSIAEAVREGQFHLWAAYNMDEVMTLLTDIKAGTEQRNGRFERNSVNEQIRRSLQELTTISGMQGV